MNEEIAVCKKAERYLNLTMGRHKHPSELRWTKTCSCDFCYTGEE